MTGSQNPPAHDPLLGKRGAFEGVARRHGRRRNPARMTPRSSLRTPTNTTRHTPQAWCEEIGRSIANSETPQNAEDIIAIGASLGINPRNLLDALKTGSGSRFALQFLAGEISPEMSQHLSDSTTPPAST